MDHETLTYADVDWGIQNRVIFQKTQIQVFFFQDAEATEQQEGSLKLTADCYEKS